MDSLPILRWMLAPKYLAAFKPSVPAKIRKSESTPSWFSIQKFAINRFFASYRPGVPWTYVLGNFASQSLPLDDDVRLTIQRTGSKTIDTIQVGPLRFSLLLNVLTISS